MQEAMYNCCKCSAKFSDLKVLTEHILEKCVAKSPNSSVKYRQTIPEKISDKAETIKRKIFPENVKITSILPDTQCDSEDCRQEVDIVLPVSTKEIFQNPTEQQTRNMPKRPETREKEELGNPLHIKQTKDEVIKQKEHKKFELDEPKMHDNTSKNDELSTDKLNDPSSGGGIIKKYNRPLQIEIRSEEIVNNLEDTGEKLKKEVNSNDVSNIKQIEECGFCQTEKSDEKSGVEEKLMKNTSTCDNTSIGETLEPKKEPLKSLIDFENLKVCSFCRKSFTFYCELKKHKSKDCQAFLTVREKYKLLFSQKHICRDCSLKFTNANALKVHRLVYCKLYKKKKGNNSNAKRRTAKKNSLGVQKTRNSKESIVQRLGSQKSTISTNKNIIMKRGRNESNLNKKRSSISRMCKQIETEKVNRNNTGRNYSKDKVTTIEKVTAMDHEVKKEVTQNNNESVKASISPIYSPSDSLSQNSVNGKSEEKLKKPKSPISAPEKDPAEDQNICNICGYQFEYLFALQKHKQLYCKTFNVTKPSTTSNKISEVSKCINKILSISKDITKERAETPKIDESTNESEMKKKRLKVSPEVKNVHVSKLITCSACSQIFKNSAEFNSHERGGCLQNKKDEETDVLELEPDITEKWPIDIESEQHEEETKPENKSTTPVHSTNLKRKVCSETNDLADISLEQNLESKKRKISLDLRETLQNKSEVKVVIDSNKLTEKEPRSANQNVPSAADDMMEKQKSELPKNTDVQKLLNDKTSQPKLKHDHLSPVSTSIVHPTATRIYNKVTTFKNVEALKPSIFCEKCGKSIFNVQEVDNPDCGHQSTIFKCPVCQGNNHNLNMLILHLKKQHNPHEVRLKEKQNVDKNVGNRYYCCICGTSFYFIEDLMRHRQNLHTSGSLGYVVRAARESLKFYACVYCKNLEFKSLELLLEHEEKSECHHRNVESLKDLKPNYAPLRKQTVEQVCYICKLAFFTFRDLQVHMLECPKHYMLEKKLLEIAKLKNKHRPKIEEGYPVTFENEYPVRNHDDINAYNSYYEQYYSVHPSYQELSRDFPVPYLSPLDYDLKVRHDLFYSDHQMVYNPISASRYHHIDNLRETRHIETYGNLQDIADLDVRRENRYIETYRNIRDPANTSDWDVGRENRYMETYGSLEDTADTSILNFRRENRYIETYRNIRDPANTFDLDVGRENRYIETHGPLQDTADSSYSDVRRENRYVEIYPNSKGTADISDLHANRHMEMYSDSKSTANISDSNVWRENRYMGPNLRGIASKSDLDVRRENRDMEVYPKSMGTPSKSDENLRYSPLSSIRSTDLYKKVAGALNSNSAISDAVHIHENKKIDSPIPLFKESISAADLQKVSRLLKLPATSQFNPLEEIVSAAKFSSSSTFSRQNLYRPISATSAVSYSIPKDADLQSTSMLPSNTLTIPDKISSTKSEAIQPTSSNNRNIPDTGNYYDKDKRNTLKHTEDDSLKKDRSAIKMQRNLGKEPKKASTEIASYSKSANREAIQSTSNNNRNIPDTGNYYDNHKHNALEHNEDDSLKKDRNVVKMQRNVGKEHKTEIASYSKLANREATQSTPTISSNNRTAADMGSYYDRPNHDVLRHNAPESFEKCKDATKTQRKADRNPEVLFEIVDSSDDEANEFVGPGYKRVGKRKTANEGQRKVGKQPEIVCEIILSSGDEESLEREQCLACSEYFRTSRDLEKHDCRGPF